MNDLGMNGFGMGWGWLIPILLIVSLVYMLTDKTQKIGKLSPKEILDIRLAKGEIDEDEYKKYLKLLKK